MADAAELTGGFGPPGPAALPDRIEEIFQRQLTQLQPRRGDCC